MNAEMLFGLFGILVMLLLILFTGMSPGLAMLLVGTIGCISLMPEITLHTIFAGTTGMEVWRHACEEDEKQHHDDAEKTEDHFRVHFASSFDSVTSDVILPSFSLGNTTSLRMDVTTPLRSPLVSASVSGSFRVSR